MSKTTTTWHDANGFPHELPYPVNFTLEESDTWICKVCDQDVHADVDDKGHRFDGDTAMQIWTACPMEGDGDGDVWTGTFEEALKFFTESFMTEYEVQTDYGTGWELSTTETDLKDAEASLADYRSNQPEYRHRIKRVRTT